MTDKIRIGILGYGNLGKGVELAVRQNPDMELAAFFTRRDPESLKTQSPEVPVYNIKDAVSKKDDIDVMILCGGSATDLPVQSPEYAKYFNIVDSFDTHAKIPEHFANVDASAKEGGHVAGTPVCSACRDCWATASCPKARIIPSGAEVSARAIPMPSEESKA